VAQLISLPLRVQTPFSRIDGVPKIGTINKVMQLICQRLKVYPKSRHFSRWVSYSVCRRASSSGVVRNFGANFRCGHCPTRQSIAATHSAHHRTRCEAPQTAREPVSSREPHWCSRNGSSYGWTELSQPGMNRVSFDYKSIKPAVHYSPL
jgi:hypothetical protein